MFKGILSCMVGMVAGAGIVHFSKKENRDKALAKGREVCRKIGAQFTEAQQRQLAKELAKATGKAVEDCLASVQAVVRGERPPRQTGTSTPEGEVKKEEK